jgi:hypothetical protein
MIQDQDSNNRLKWWEKLIIVMIAVLMVLILFLIFNEKIFSAINDFKIWYEGS